MDLFIISGGSRGFGEALTKLALDQDHGVIAISRYEIQNTSSNLAFYSISHDLSDFTGLTEKLEKTLHLFETHHPFDLQSVHLINNAALIEPVGPLVNLEPEAIQKSIRVNLESPILLTQFFLQHFNHFEGWKTVTNISSGAAFRPIPSWELYCSTKAGLKMFSENLDLDLMDQKAKVISFSPGIMDTSMQKHIRSLSPSQFPRVVDFQKMKEEHQLRNPQTVASCLLQLLSLPEQIGKVVYDVQEFD